jgi:hypothetical protein
VEITCFGGPEVMDVANLLVVPGKARLHVVGRGGSNQADTHLRQSRK